MTRVYVTEVDKNFITKMFVTETSKGVSIKTIEIRNGIEKETFNKIINKQELPDFIVELEKIQNKYDRLD